MWKLRTLHKIVLGPSLVSRATPSNHCWPARLVLRLIPKPFTYILQCHAHASPIILQEKNCISWCQRWFQSWRHVREVKHQASRAVEPVEEEVAEGEGARRRKENASSCILSVRYCCILFFIITIIISSMSHDQKTLLTWQQYTSLHETIGETIIYTSFNSSSVWNCNLCECVMERKAKSTGDHRRICRWKS